MRNLLRITCLGLALVGFSANASLNIKSVELIDSTVIDGSEISAITLFNSDAKVQSVETTGGLLINASEIKNIHISSPRNPHYEIMSRVGGEGSGG
jgi:hypothetical protein